jgi:hypothetical protein
MDYFKKDTIAVEGNCEIMALKHEYEIFNVLVERKCQKL